MGWQHGYDAPKKEKMSARDARMFWQNYGHFLLFWSSSCFTEGTIVYTKCKIIICGFTYKATLFCTRQIVSTRI